MATTGDIFRLDPIVRELGRLLFALVTRELPGENSWTLALLDARFDEQGGFITKIRVNCANGEVVSPSMPTDITLQLIELNSIRPTGQDRWYGFKLEVTNASACEVKFDYDPACADDPDFFNS